ncbi:MAG: hypothetical protein AAB534_00450 [Patescibacteria group bacterium]
MLNESLFSLSLNDLKNVVVQDLTIFDVALVYVLVYVVYKALGRYIYFKPQEHASKINRTFLVLSLLVISLHFLASITNHLPFLSGYRWLYATCSLVLIIAPLSIIMDRVIWKYSRTGEKELRYWNYMPIQFDYYKTTVSKSEKNGYFTKSWEEEGVESTMRNLHSDALLNVSALIIFIAVGIQWSYESIVSYGWYSFIFFVIITLWISAIFLDRGLFAWIEYLERKHNTKQR